MRSIIGDKGKRKEGSQIFWAGGKPVIGVVAKGIEKEFLISLKGSIVRVGLKLIERREIKSLLGLE